MGVASAIMHFSTRVNTGKARSSFRISSTSSSYRHLPFFQSRYAVLRQQATMCLNQLIESRDHLLNERMRSILPLARHSQVGSWTSKATTFFSTPFCRIRTELPLRVNYVYIRFSKLDLLRLSTQNRRVNRQKLSPPREKGGISMSRVSVWKLKPGDNAID